MKTRQYSLFIGAFLLSLLFLVTDLNAQTQVFDLGKIVVAEKKKDDRGEEITKIDEKTLKSHKVVDLSEILSDELIEATMIRKSGYGNEVGLRGFTKSNLRFTQDNTLIEGSCGSRKDPPLSHINLLTVDKIEVKEGPYDVTVPGALGGAVNVVTKETQQGFKGELFSKFGSFNYLSQGGYITGGTDSLQGLVGYNYSKSGQYEDGAGNKLHSLNENYNSDGRNMDAFSKHDIWGKVMFKPADKQRLYLSFSYGLAKDIMTPRVGMDTEKEQTYLGNMKYVIDGLGSFSEELQVSAYYNRIEHYPYGEYRSNAVNNKRIEAISSITGAQVQNVTEASLATFTYGIDFYYRNWYGDIINRDTDETLNDELFPDVDEFDFGAYIKAERELGKLFLTAGLRGDLFKTEAQEDLKFSKSTTDENEQTDLFPSANVFLKYFFAGKSNIFGGMGMSTRTPTTVERYIQESSSFHGNPELKPAHNYEADLGIYTVLAECLTFKTKGFYSYLKNYIYQFETTGGTKTYTNIDAYLYGGDATVDCRSSLGLGLESGLAYQRGVKLEKPENNDDKDLAEISPLKTKVALYYDKKGFFCIYEWVHSEKNSNIDSDAGETSLDGWNVFNLRMSYRFEEMSGGASFLNGLSLNFGIDNMFDVKYAVANSYEYDPTDPGGQNVKVVNEPGRFIYGSLSYIF